MISNKLKKILTSILIICILVTFIPTWTLDCFAATSGTCGDNLKWTYSEGTLKISGSGCMENYQYGSVPWWDLRDETTTIIVDSSVTSIGNNAFYNFSSLKNVQLSDSVVSIGNYAFAHCTSLSTITLPARVSTIGNCAFRYCTNLHNIKVDVGNTSYCDVSGVLFDKNIRRLQCYPAGKTGNTYVIPESVTIIEQEAFAFCENLVNITLPSRLTTIKNGAFWCCENWSGMILPSTVTSIGDNAFGHCSRLTDIKIPSAINSIGFGAFLHCSGITEADLSCNISRISGDTFAGCSSLKSVIIPKGVESIGGNAFSGCNSLTRVYFEGGSISWDNIEISYGNERLTNASITFNYDSPDNIEQGRLVYKEGYNSTLDRYHFSNLVRTVSKDIYEDVYGELKGEVLYKKKEEEKEPHGLCYGMAVTTASLWLKAPIVESFHSAGAICRSMSYILPESQNVVLNGITAETFIKYGFVTQFSTQASKNYINSCEKIYNAVYDYVYREGKPVTIHLFSWTYDDVTKKWEGDFGHAILAVGLQGNNKIVVDDSNFPDELKTITLERDSFGAFTGKWSYPDYSELINGDNVISDQAAIPQKRKSVIACAIGSHVILADLVLEYEKELDYEMTIISENEEKTVLCDFDPIDQEYNLCCVKADTYDLNGIQEVIPVEEPQMGTFNTDTGNDLFWVANDEAIVVNEVTGQNNEIIVAGNDILISASVSESDSVAVTLNEKDNDVSVNIDSQSGEDYKILFESTSENQEEILLSVEGTANGETVEAVQTSTGIVVNGLTEAEVKLSYDENIVQEEKISELKGDINIIYDKDDSDKKVVVEYEKPESLTGNIDIEGELISGSKIEVMVTESNNTGIMYYQWYVDDTAIENATDANYILTDNEVGHRMKVVVSSSEQSGTIECETTEIVKEKDHSLAIVLAEAKEAAKKEVAEYKNAEDYREAEVAELATIISEAIVAIDVAKTVEAVAKIVEDVKAEMDALPVIIPVDPSDVSLDVPVDMYTATAGSTQSGNSPEAALDGNAGSFWEVAWDIGNTNPELLWYQIELADEIEIDAVRYLPRWGSGQGDQNGFITEYLIEVSTDGENWTTVATGTWEMTEGWKIVEFPAVTAKYVRLTGTGTYADVGNNSNMSIAEIRVRATGVVINKTALKEAIAEAEGLVSEDYVDMSGVNTALAAAKEVAAITDATQEEVDAAAAALNEAIDALEQKPVEPPVEENKVVRLYGAGRYETGYAVADALKEALGVEKFEAVVVATGKNFTDALAGSYLAVEENAPILLTNGKDENVAELHAYIAANVVEGGKVYILGGEAAVPASVEAISGYDVVRLFGDSRYDTNLAILEEAGVSGDSIIVATGKTFADSLSASAAKLPILLVKPNGTLNDAQKAILAGMNNIYIVGGEGAVSTAYEAELKEFGEVTRVFGESRYDTSVEVAKTFCGDVGTAVVVSGKNFPDGLCGGPLAAVLNAPLVLTKDDGAGVAAAYVTEESITGGYVLGGDGALTDATVVEVFALESVEKIK